MKQEGIYIYNQTCSRQGQALEFGSWILFPFQKCKDPNQEGTKRQKANSKLKIEDLSEMLKPEINC